MSGWWRPCGCGCTKWHQFERCGPVDAPHTAVYVGSKAVQWVVNPAERCGDCLLAEDEVVTTRARATLASVQADFVKALDAGIQLIGQQLDAEAAQIADTTVEGCPPPAKDEP